MANLSAFGGAQPLYPGGTVELGYEEFSYVGNVTATSGSPLAVMSPLTVVCDGSPILIDGCIAGIRPANTAGAQIVVELYEDGSLINSQWALVITPASGDRFSPASCHLRRTPTAGSHTYQVKVYVSSGSGYISNGEAGRPPSFLRVSKIVNQNDGLKPFWTPPVVTQLPSNATVGDQVVNYTTSGAYQPYFYTGATDGWKQVGTSKAPACVVQRKTTAQSLTNGAVQVINWDTETVDTDGMFSPTSTNVTVQTAGLYSITLNAIFPNNSTGQRILWITKNAAVSGSGDSMTATLSSSAIAATGSDASASTNDYKSCSCVVPLAANDVIRAVAYQNSGGALNVGDSSNITNVTSMSLTWLGAT